MILNSVGRKETVQDTQTNRDEEIRQVAYKLWQEEGCPDGYDVQHWLKAETVWLEEKRPKNKPKQSKSLKARKGRQTRTAEQEL
jgi:Protein of unknown function (DUF2934)